MIREQDIVYENGRAWVLKDKTGYYVQVQSLNNTHSVTDSAYALNDDGLSIAKARCDYIANK